MGLDLCIRKKRKGEAYASSNWEEIAYSRNGWEVRQIILDNISTYDEDTQTAKLTIGTLNEIIVKLAEALKEFNFNDYVDSLAYYRIANFLGQLASNLAVDIVDMEEDNIFYEYCLIDSY